jgi:hypothetical protein
MIFSRINFAASALIILASCGNIQNDDSAVKQIWTALTAPEQAASTTLDIDTFRAGLTPEVLAQIDGPILIAQVPSRDAVAVLTRAGTNSGVDTFLTPDGISISLRDGMVIATRGLGFDLMTADIAEPLTALKGFRQSAVRIHRYLDGENQPIERSFVCAYSVTGTRQVAETCTSSSDAFKNNYILDKEGNITSSRQWISPQIGSVVTELYD